MIAVEEFGENGLPVVKLEAKADALHKYERVKRELDTTSLRLDLQDPRTQQPAVRRQQGTRERAVLRGHVRARPAGLERRGFDAAEQEFRAALKLDPGKTPRRIANWRRSIEGAENSMTPCRN